MLFYKVLLSSLMWVMLTFLELLMYKTHFHHSNISLIVLLVGYLVKYCLPCRSYSSCSDPVEPALRLIFLFPPVTCMYTTCTCVCSSFISLILGSATQDLYFLTIIDCSCGIVLHSYLSVIHTSSFRYYLSQAYLIKSSSGCWN